MTIDISSETLLDLRQASNSLPGRPSVSTLHRWRLRGIRGRKLATVLVGGRRFTSQEALANFTAAVTAAADGEPIASRTHALRQRAIERAENVLAADGI